MALPTDPQAMLESVVRIYGSTGPGRVTVKTRITVYAVQAGGVVPLVGLRGSESAWWKKLDDDTWVRHSSTLSFFQDLATGQFIESFTNPLNGFTGKVAVSFIRHKEGEYRTTRGDYYGSMRKAFPQSYPDQPIAPDWNLDAGIVRLRGRSNFPPILKQPTLETATLSVRAAELFDPAIATPQASVAGQAPLTSLDSCVSMCVEVYTWLRTCRSTRSSSIAPWRSVAKPPRKRR